MGTEIGNPDGTVSDAMVEYYRQRAEGEYGLIVTEVMAVNPLGKANPNEPGLFDDTHIPGLKRMADAMHAHGAKCFVQLHHGGRQCRYATTGFIAHAPSPIPGGDGVPPIEMSNEEVWEVISDHGDAALRVKKAGYDGVEIHCGHGYLIAEFMSAYANKRTDEFGGDITGRMKFATEIIKDIHKKCGDDFPVIAKFSAEERVVGGTEIEEACVMADMLEEAGLAAITVSTGVGSNFSSCAWVCAPQGAPKGYNVKAAARIKESVSIPVGVCGRIMDPAHAAKLVKDGVVDFVSTGRVSLADPHFPKKIKENRTDEICPCTGCVQACVLGGDFGAAVGCLANPFCGVETKLVLKPVETPKKVVVVGAGPGGMAAAWMLASKGHNVKLFEKKNVVGGQFRYASMPPAKQDFARFLKYQHTMCKKYNVDMQFNTEATAELILAEKPDAVVLATGAVAGIPPIPGIEKAKVYTAVEALAGKVIVGAKPLIIGGGDTGLETGEYMVEQGREVTLLEMGPAIAPEMHMFRKLFLFDRLKNYRATLNMITGATVKEVLEDGVIYEKDGEIAELRGFTEIVMAAGVKPYNPLEAELTDKVAELYVIGDAKKPAKASLANRAAAEIAVRI